MGVQWDQPCADVRASFALPQSVLVKIASNRVESWKLVTREAKTWAVDMSRSIRVMLRHVGKGVGRTVFLVAERGTGIWEGWWDGGTVG